MTQTNKIENNIELISLHIPKTAGTSFRDILKKVYGKSKLARVDIRKDIRLNKKQLRDSSLKNKIAVVHGHFSYKDFKQNFDIPEGCNVITWLRNPTERVISNFYYLDSVSKSRFRSKKRENIRSKLHKSLLEYAQEEMNRNRMSKFLKGTTPEELFFVGITEHYEEDIRFLSELLGWSSYPVFRRNRTPRKPIIDDQTRQEIEKLNHLDYEIYNKALQIRAERMKSSS